MEEKKNNAIEKVENIINGSKGENPTKDAEIKAERVGEIQRTQNLKDQRRLERARKKATMRSKKEYERKEKQRYKTIKKAQRKQEREENKEIKRQNSKGNGFKIATISLGISTLVLSSVLMLNYILPSTNDTAMENAYRRAFYDTIEQVDSIDANLSKALMTKDGDALQIYLVDTAINSELCENDIQSLPLKDESKYYSAKLVNQIGDFCKYLNKKLVDGESLTSKDRTSLRTLYTANKELQNSLQKTMGEMKGDFSFTQIADGGRGNAFTKNFDTLQNLSATFPELIYDGPFSDGTAGREIKGLTGDNIDKSGAVKVFEKIFNSRGVENVSCTGKTQKDIITYNVKGDVKGDEIYAEITEKGGKLLMFSFVGECNKVNHTEEEAIASGKAFLSEIGINNMEAVWVNLANNVYTINFAYEENGTTIYSDLIKVRVCGETCGVIGIEATTYYTNHKERTLESPSISVSIARGKVSDDIDVKTERRCIVPIGNSAEKLCYEFMGTDGESTYYVYIDAKSGRQVEMFRVIESTEGKLLI